MVCPNDAIMPMHSDEADKALVSISTEGGRATNAAAAVGMSPGGVLDRIKFTRISMLTDPALDAGRHEFETENASWVAILPPEENIRK